MALKKTVGSLIFCVDGFSQTSPECAKVFIEKVSSVKAGPLRLKNGRKFQFLPLRLLSHVKRKNVKRAFKRIATFRLVRLSLD